jgi:hypothetical protein
VGIVFCVAGLGAWTYASANGRNQVRDEVRTRLLKDDACTVAVNRIMSDFQQALRTRVDPMVVIEDYTKKLEALTKSADPKGLCTKQKELFEQLVQIEKSKQEAIECAAKVDMLPSALRGEPTNEGLRPRVVAAWFGDIVHEKKYRQGRFTCDATTFFWNRCHNTATTAGKVLLGPSYCIAERDSGVDLATGIDLCGYDPAPDANAEDTYEFRREKFLVVAYLCGDGPKRERKVTVPAGSKSIPIVCEYPDRLVAPLELDLLQGNCAVKAKQP